MPHTPEPWELHYHSLDEIYILHLVDAKSGRSIPLALIRDWGELSPGELESNAELLVRAPRMLRLLQSSAFFHSVREAMRTIHSKTTEGKNMLQELDDLLEELKKAGAQ